MKNRELAVNLVEGTHKNDPFEWGGEYCPCPICTKCCCNDDKCANNDDKGKCKCTADEKKAWREKNESVVQESGTDRYSLVKVGGFRIGDFPTIAAAKRGLKGREGSMHRPGPGFYQIIDNNSGLAVWEGEYRG